MLQERDHLVLAFMARYQLATCQTLVRAPFFAQQHASQEVVKGVTKRLRAAGYIQSFPLYGKHTYDQLTLRGAACCGAHPRVARPLPPQAKIRAYAVLCYCCQVQPIRLKLTPDEFSQRFPTLYRSGEPVNYFIDEHENHKRLVYIQVDYARLGRCDRVFGRLVQLVAKRCDRPAYRKLIAEGRFAIALVTFTPEKAQWMRHEALERNLPVPVMVEHVDGLVNLFAPPRKQRPGTMTG